MAMLASAIEKANLDFIGWIGWTEKLNEFTVNGMA
jgi:hypothetical protein